MDQNKFRTLLKCYLSCMDAEQATQLKLRQNQEYQTFIQPNQGMQEQLFIQGLPELQVALFNDRERKFILERSADGESLVDLHYGFPILKDEKDMISPLFFVEVAANFAGDQMLRLFPKVKNFSVNRAHFLGRYSPEEIEGICEELEGEFGSFEARMNAAKNYIPNFNSLIGVPILFRTNKGGIRDKLRYELLQLFKSDDLLSNTLKNALQNAPKLLLTATPLQNSLLELFGLVSFVDEQTFGDLKSFREQFLHLNEEQVFNTLKTRLKPVCHRTLRRQVQSVPYTKRLPMVEQFKPEESEDRLYQLVSDYLRRENLQALPNSQRKLMTLVLRKLLASSTFAIAGALETLIRRMKDKLAKQNPSLSLEEELDEDYEALDETAEEWDEEADVEILSEADQKALAKEIADLESFRDLAVSITYNAKGKALLTALDKAFTTPKLPRKAIVFTGNEDHVVGDGTIPDA